MIDGGYAPTLTWDDYLDGGWAPSTFTDSVDGGGSEMPFGIVPIPVPTTSSILYGSRVTSYRWEVLTHASGTDTLAGYLDGVVEGSATLDWSLYTAVKGTGKLAVENLTTAASGLMRIADVALPSQRLRPVLIVDGLPEIPLGVYLISAAPEEWSDAGKILNLELLDRCTVLDQDAVDASYTVAAGTVILSAVATVVASAGEQITVDAAITTTLGNPMVWDAGTSKLQIVNDLLGVLNYNSLWVDGSGQFQATPYVVPASRSIYYELLTGIPRDLIDGATSIYSQDWSRDQDLFAVPNKVIAVQSSSAAAAALTGTYTNTDPASPFSYPSRGRWITKTLSGVETPAGSDPTVIAFLQAAAQRSLIASSSVQAAVKVKHLPIPIRVSDEMRFANTPAGIDARHVVTNLSLEANPLGLMTSTLQQVVVL